MRVTALAVALRTITESGLRFRDTPVPAAARGVALLAGARIVIEPRCGNLRVCGRRPRSVPPSSPRWRRRPCRSRQRPPGTAGTICWDRVLFEGLPALGLPLLSFRRRPPGSDDLHPVAGDLHTAHCGATIIPVAMEAIAVLARTLGALRSPAGCAVLSRSHPPGAALRGQIPRTNRGQTIRKA